MKKNTLILLAIITVTLSIISIIIGIQTIQKNHHTMINNQESQTHNSMNNMPCHQMSDGSWMGNCNTNMDHSHMNHEVSSELEFIVEMIPHHQEAVDSSIQLLELGTNNQKLENLLYEIINAQKEEIAMMKTWLEQWYLEENYEASYIEMMPDLSNLPENQRDQAYIQAMVMHHEMAIVMAKSVLEIENIRDEVRELALEIIRVQKEEIDFMNSLLN